MGIAGSCEDAPQAGLFSQGEAWVALCLTLDSWSPDPGSGSTLEGGQVSHQQ